MANSFKWSKTALSDLKHIKMSISKDDPQAAIGMLRRIIQATEKQLIQFPGIGRPGRIYGTKELVISPYIVAYRVQQLSTIEILAILHEAQIWPDEF
jgi:toxin ParE1/3/4